jgi:hypothetical protein
MVEQCTRVSYAVKHNLQANYPLVLSGDHSSAWDDKRYQSGLSYKVIGCRLD